MIFRAKRYAFRNRGPNHSLHPAIAVRLGPLILFGVWFVRRRQRELTPGAARLLKRLGETANA